jgi:hypothetical protein
LVEKLTDLEGLVKLVLALGLMAVATDMESVALVFLCCLAIPEQLDHGAQQALLVRRARQVVALRLLSALDPCKTVVSDGQEQHNIPRNSCWAVCCASSEAWLGSSSPLRLRSR